MKRIIAFPITAAILAGGAAAQEEQGWQRMKVEADRVMAQVRTMSINGVVTGPAVKSAPYSATEISENTQVLADGTRIHNETQTVVYRDSEGRVRRETPDQVTIWDPVENTSYVLNPKTQTARQIKLAKATLRSEPGGPIHTFSVAVPPPPGEGPGVAIGHGSDGPGANVMYEVRTETIETKSGAAADKAKAEALARAGVMRADVGPQTFALSGGPQGVVMKGSKEESLGKQSIEGVLAEGTRTKMVLETGAIGNDRPIESLNERWYSPDLQTVVMTKHSDPRTGDVVFRLTNINRSEPAAYLFQVPSGYQVTEQK
jgi:hypothetical protein